jgi:arginyl-tRNA synthetase
MSRARRGVRAPRGGTPQTLNGYESTRILSGFIRIHSRRTPRSPRGAPGAGYAASGLTLCESLYSGIDLGGYLAQCGGKQVRRTVGLVYCPHRRSAAGERRPAPRAACGPLPFRSWARDDGRGQMIRDEIARLVEQATREAMARGDLPTVPLPEVTIDRPRLPEHGDYASNLPLRLQRAVGGRPLDIAEKIRAALPPAPLVGSVSVAPPGFLNFRLSDAWLAAQVDHILACGEAFADAESAVGQRVQIEFVSANPTGAPHVGNGRGAVFGSTLAAVLEARGYSVVREYYVNDAGAQIDALARTVWARYQQECGRDVPLPADGYPDEYLRDVARRVRAELGDGPLHEGDGQVPRALAERAVALIVRRIQEDLAALGVHYDVWFHERSLYAPAGQYEKVMELLRRRGYVEEREGALWFTSTELGEEKDNVLVRSSGAPTYFASDIAYHYNKFVERGFDRVINIWGADHHGHVSRLKAAVAALGIDPARLTILLYQLVMLKRGGEAVRLSKRAGEIVQLRDLVDEVGVDACRFFFLQRSADATLDFDVELAKTQNEKNPVYYVQYAHARIAGILRTAAERGLSPDGGDVRLLTHPAELALVRKMLQLPELLDQVARTLEPHHLPYYAMDLATTFHAFYRDVRVLPRADGPEDGADGGPAQDDVPTGADREALARARLRLVAAARIALARTLHLMGMSAPERM